MAVMDRHRISQEFGDVGDELIGRGGHGYLVLPEIEVQVVGKAGAPVRSLLGVEEAEGAGLGLLNLFDLIKVLRRLLGSALLVMLLETLWYSGP